ncbi:MAG: DUF4224 domain-containing protein [Terriglobales bacterium]
MNALLLSLEELVELTGHTQAAAQRRWLTRNHIRHWIRADGHPSVPRDAVSGAAPASLSAARTTPDFAAPRH